MFKNIEQQSVMEQNDSTVALLENETLLFNLRDRNQRIKRSEFNKVFITGI